MIKDIASESKCYDCEYSTFLRVNLLFLFVFVFVVTKCDCKTDRLWVRSPLEEMTYLLKFIFPFLRSSVEAKRGVEFCHSTELN